MTVFHLVRHASHVLQDRVMVGRTPGVALSGIGQAQARALAERFAGMPLEGVVSSPRRRARETARAIAATSGALLEIADGLDELNFGEWTGRTPDDLSGDPRWHDWNTHRATQRCPGGESMGEVFGRVMSVLRDLQHRAPHGVFAIVTHAEPIRALVLAATCRSFDDFHVVVVEPASVMTVTLDGERLALARPDVKAAA